MLDPGRSRVKRHGHSSPFWGIMFLFALVVIGLVAYGYHGIQTLQTAGTTTSAVEAAQGESGVDSSPVNRP